MNAAAQRDDMGVEIIDVSDNPGALDGIARAEIDMAIATARKYPRQIAKFVDEVVSLATIDQDTAEGCFYSLRRQGKTIQGPSVRLAEIAVSSWGNIRAGARVVGESPDGKFIVAQGICHDLEKNVYVAMESHRRITNRQGQKYGDDMIGVTANAAAAIGFRNAAFKVIPKALIKKAYVKCIAVATGGAKTLVERREQCFERLQALNPLITPERILAMLDKPSIEEVTTADVTHLIGLGTAIRDGAQEVDQAFPEPKMTAEDVLPEKKKSEEPKESKKEAKSESPEPEVTEEKAPEPEAEPEPEKKADPPKLLTASKIKSLIRQAHELAGMDEAALERFSKRAFACKLAEAPAGSEGDILKEIRRRAEKLA